MWPFKFPYTNFHELNLDWLLETVKSNTDRIAENEQKIKLIGGDDPLNSLHPVGSIFISTENTSPASMFGGEWEKIGGKFLLGASDSYLAGSTGGRQQFTIVDNNLTGNTMLFLNSDISNGFSTGVWGTHGSGYGAIPLSQSQFSSSVPIDIMPPYLAVNMWRRVS